MMALIVLQIRHRKEIIMGSEIWTAKSGQAAIS